MNRYLVSLLLALCISGGLAPRQAWAAEIPAWMQSLPSIELPAHDEKMPAVQLYSETILTVQNDGRLRRTIRAAFKILRPDGAHRGVVRSDVDATSTVLSMRGWCIPVSGKPYETRDRDAIETSLPGVEGGELVSDLRSKLLEIPAAVPGNIVGYEVETEEKPYVLADQWDFQDTVPVVRARYTLQLPSDWNYQSSWLNFAAQTPQTTAPQRFTWELHNLSAIRIERNMPPWRGIAGALMLSLQPPNGLPSGFRSWPEEGAWYSSLAANRRVATAAIKAKVQSLTAEQPTPLQKVKALAAFVQSDIRYVAIELGIGGHQPHAADEIFTRRFGDCKDKATLLGAMLKEIGVESFYTLVNSERGSVNANTPPNFGFDHVILAIQLTPALLDKTLLGVQNHSRLGSLLFFDPTDSLTPFGRINGALQAGFALLALPDGGELLQLPQLAPETNSVARTATLTLSDDGMLAGDFREIRNGDPASALRGTLMAVDASTDQIKPAEAVLSDSLATFRVIRAQMAGLRDTTKPFEFRYSIEADNYSKLAGDLLLVRPRVVGSMSSGLLETKEARQHPIEFDGPRHDTDVFDIVLPTGYELDELPPPVSVDYGFASYSSRSEMKGNTLHYTRSREIRRLSVPAAEAAKLKEFYRIIANDERMQAVFKRRTP